MSSHEPRHPCHDPYMAYVKDPHHVMVDAYEGRCRAWWQWMYVNLTASSWRHPTVSCTLHRRWSILRTPLLSLKSDNNISNNPRIGSAALSWGSSPRVLMCMSNRSKHTRTGTEQHGSEQRSWSRIGCLFEGVREQGPPSAYPLTAQHYEIQSPLERKMYSWQWMKIEFVFFRALRDYVFSPLTAASCRVCHYWIKTEHGSTAAALQLNGTCISV